MKKKKFLIGGLIVCLAIAYLGYTGFESSATYYLTISELREKGDSVYGKNVRVSGQVVPPSVDQKGAVLSFTIADGGQSLPVVYQGVVPDAFKAGSQVVVEGYLNSAGIFQANTILTKCPSKYTPGK